MPTNKIHTAAELKARVLAANPESLFFSRNNMKYSGDTMGNYGVTGPVEIETWSGPATVYELFRRRPVKHGLQKSAYFEVGTFEQRFRKS